MNNLELLNGICLELGIDVSSGTFDRLSDFYQKTKRVPNPEEVAFIHAALRKDEEASARKLCLREAECCSEDFRVLLADFIKRYNRAASGISNPSITALAEYAATGKATTERCGLFVDLADDRDFPDVYSGATETVRAGELTLTLSTGAALCGRSFGDICAMISPTAGQDIDEFIEKCTAVCRGFSKKHPNTAIIPVSPDGLIADLSHTAVGYVIDTSLFPVPADSPTSVFSISKPSVLIFSRREHLHELWEIAAAHGITPTAPIANRAKYVCIRSGNVSLEFNNSDLDFFSSTTDVRMGSCEHPILDGATVVTAEHELTVSDDVLTVLKLGGDCIYEALEEATADYDALYAICGVLAVDDDSTLPMIISLDSFRRNRQPKVIYSRFFMGDRASLYVFKLAKKK